MKVWNITTGLFFQDDFENIKNDENVSLHPVVLFDKTQSRVIYNKRTEFKVPSDFFQYDFIYLIRGSQKILLTKKDNQKFENSFKTYRGLKNF